MLEAGAALSPAEAAQRLLQRWSRDWPERPPALVRVPAPRHAALVDHLRPRLLKLAPQPGPFPGFRVLLQAVLDDGGALVAGGRTLADGAVEPTLILNLDPSSRALRVSVPSGPLLAVLRDEDGLPAADVPREFVRLDSEPAA